MDKSKIPFGKLHTAFELYNRTTNKSPRTVQWYNDKLILFERHLGSNAVLADLTLDNVRAFIAELQSRGVVHANSRFVKNKTGSLSSSYIQGFARALRAFASWLYEEGYTTTNVLKTLRPPRVQHKVIEVLTDKEVSALLGLFNRSDPLRRPQLRRHHHFAGLRLRAAELCSLLIADSHLEQGYLKALGKGNKERLVPVGQSAQDALILWRDGDVLLIGH